MKGLYWTAGLLAVGFLVLSCGGGMPPGAGTENIEAFLEAARG